MFCKHEYLRVVDEVDGEDDEADARVDNVEEWNFNNSSAGNHSHEDPTDDKDEEDAE
jgi:hypothetical protein